MSVYLAVRSGNTGFLYLSIVTQGVDATFSGGGDDEGGSGEGGGGEGGGEGGGGEGGGRGEGGAAGLQQ